MLLEASSASDTYQDRKVSAMLRSSIPQITR